MCQVRKFMHVIELIPQYDMNGGGEGLMYIICWPRVPFLVHDTLQRMHAN